jgi:hypothetical protein
MDSTNSCLISLSDNIDSLTNLSNSVISKIK